MRTIRIFITLAIAFAMTSCGTQKAAVTETETGPTIQTQFFGAKFEDSSNRVYVYTSSRTP